MSANAVLTEEEHNEKISEGEDPRFLDIITDENNNEFYYSLDDFFFNSKTSGKLVSHQQIKEWAIVQIYRFKNVIDIMGGGSNFKFHKMIFLRIQNSKGKKTRVGSYIETPKILKVVL